MAWSRMHSYYQHLLSPRCVSISKYRWFICPMDMSPVSPTDDKIWRRLLTTIGLRLPLNHDTDMMEVREVGTDVGFTLAYCSSSSHPWVGLSGTCCRQHDALSPAKRCF